MIKIKDNVDLKELEKFGFELNQFGELSKIIYEGRRGQAFEIIINEFNRKIEGYAYGADGDGEGRVKVKKITRVLIQDSEPIDSEQYNIEQQENAIVGIYDIG